MGCSGEIFIQSNGKVKYCTDKIAKSIDYGKSYIKEILEELLQMQD